MSAFDNARATPRIGLSEEQAQLLEVAEAFCRDKSPIDKVRALIDDDTGFDAALWAEIAELGWLGIGVPENYGGIGLGMGAFALHLARRRIAIEVDGEELRVDVEGPVLDRSRAWARGDVRAVEVRPSVVSVNGRPLMHLVIEGQPKRMGLMMGRGERELEWVAELVREALGLGAGEQ